MEEINSVLGVMNFEEEIPKEILDLMQERNEARKNKNWEKSDKLREIIRSRGFEVFDEKDGSKVRKITS
jgi:cysteinyl-tRNA synthetase